MEFPRSLACLGSLAQVDEAILKTNKFLSDLYTHRNSLVPINARLPKEILCEIFLHLSASVRGNGMGYPYQWVRATHVCRYWRDISLQCPRLWAYIAPGIWEEWLDVLLSRSKQAPLTIVGPSNYYSLPCGMEAIFPHLHRIRHLQIRVSTAQWKSFHAGLNDAPLLETLCLAGEPLGPTQDAAASLPRLRHLELRDILPHGLVQPTLVSLTLKRIPAVQPVTYWVELLQGLPALQDLEIDNGFRSPEGTYQGYVGRAYLPSLRSLTLLESSEGVMSAEFLQHIDCPTSLTMTFKGTASIDDRARYDHIHRAISAKTSNDNLPHLSCCMDTGDLISFVDPTYIFQLWSTHETMESMAYAPEHLSSDPRVSMTWKGSCIRQASHSFLQSFSLPYLRALCFDRPLAPNDDTWSHCLGLTALRELRVRHRAAVESLVRALCDSGTPRQTPCFPLLEELTISHLSWCSYHPGEPHRPSTRPDLLQDLHRMLVWRKSQGLPLKRLDIDIGRNLEPQRMTRFAKDAEEQELLEVFEWWADGSMTSDCSTCRLGSETEEDDED